MSHKREQNEIVAELDALQKRVAALEGEQPAAEEVTDTPLEPKVSLGRRALLKAGWVAPIVMTLQLPNTVFANSQGPAPSPTPPPPE